MAAVGNDILRSFLQKDLRLLGRAARMMAQIVTKVSTSLRYTEPCQNREMWATITG